LVLTCVIKTRKIKIEIIILVIVVIFPEIFWFLLNLRLFLLSCPEIGRLLLFLIEEVRLLNTLVFVDLKAFEFKMQILLCFIIDEHKTFIVDTQIKLLAKLSY